MSNAADILAHGLGVLLDEPITGGHDNYRGQAAAAAAWAEVAWAAAAWSVWKATGFDWQKDVGDEPKHSRILKGKAASIDPAGYPKNGEAQSNEK